MRGYYIDAAAKSALESFVYAGSDRSLLYRHLLSPLADLLVRRCTPRRLAPNAITAAGLLLVLASALHIFYRLPRLFASADDDLPPWTFAAHAAALLIYQTLDNMDGKQARRTGTSSPLGLLFDHGCDAVNTPVTAVAFLAAAGFPEEPSLRDARTIFLLLFFPLAPFYMATWEEFFTARLDLPVFNGPNEGVLCAAASFAISARMGREWWRGSHVADALLGGRDLSNVECLALFSAALTLRESLARLLHVARRYGLKAWTHLLPFPALLWGTYVLVVQERAFFAEHAALCLATIGILFVEMVTALMLDHMTRKEFRWGRPLLAPLIMFALGRGGWPEETYPAFFLAYAAGAGVYVALRMRIVVHELCVALGIRCFSIQRDDEKSE